MRVYYLILAILIAVPGCLVAQSDDADQQADSYSYVRSHFANPPAAYRTAPFWVWNGDETRESIDQQLKDFSDEHIGGVFIHPRAGMITEYLSDEFHELVRYAVDRAKELGMEVWLYDENSFPSGFAGGLVPAQMPESYNQGQGLRLVRTTKLDKNERYVLVFRKEGEELVDVTAQLDSLYDVEADYTAFVLVSFSPTGRYAGFSYVDLLVEGVTEKFIEVTMEGYEKKVGKEFGKVVPGIFTDEPHINTPGRRMIRYTPGIFEKFEARWGYDVRPQLVSLFEETGDWQRVRHNYHALLLELFIERWSKPWYEYTESKGLKWTGHYWEHGWPDPSHGGDNMAMYAWHQVPGIDLLFNSERARPDQFGNVRNVKELSSVANQLGRRRTLSETYGAAGWELDFEDMKRLGDWEYVLGVNLMNQHLSYSTIKGARKRDFPQSFSYHAPWWPQYDVLVDYFGRLSLVLSSGKQINTTLVIEPTTSAWMYASPAGTPDRLREIGDSFESFLAELELLQIEYDLGSENIIKDRGRIEGATFVVGERAYDRVVIAPGTENLDLATVELLEQYLQNGGRVLSFVEAPKRMDGRLTARIVQLEARYPQQWVRAESPAGAAPLLAAKDFEVIEPEKVGGKLFHHRRILDEGQILFLTNFSATEASSGRVRIAGAAADVLDPFTGKIDPYPVASEGNGISFKFDLPPAGSLLLFIHNEGTPLTEQPARPFVETVIEGTPTEVVRNEPNVLVLDYVDYKAGPMEGDGIYFYTAADSIYKYHGFGEGGFGHNPWNVGVQFKKTFVEADTFSTGSGFRACYRFNISREFQDQASMRLVVEWPHLYKVFVNAKNIRPEPDQWWLDRSFGVFDIGPYLMPGLNRIAIMAMPFSVHAELEPVYLLGNFDLASRERGWEIVPADPMTLGSWKQQGLPLYSHTVSYKRTFEVADATGDYRVRLGAWNGTVAEVRVNGEKAGVVVSQPYEVDVTGKLRQGTNEVEVVVYGSLKNVLGPHHNNPQPGVVTPWSFFYAPEVQPPGDQYHTLDYGLFEEFELVSRKEGV